jgi:hypothetical protein
MKDINQRFEFLEQMLVQEKAEKQQLLQQLFQSKD